jgi:hypothetical protein
MRPPRRANAGNNVARRWRPWLWTQQDESTVEPVAAQPPVPPTPVRDELRLAESRERRPRTVEQQASRS